VVACAQREDLVLLVGQVFVERDGCLDQRGDRLVLSLHPVHELAAVPVAVGDSSDQSGGACRRCPWSATCNEPA
jgi:hypothetical protein